MRGEEGRKKRGGRIGKERGGDRRGGERRLKKGGERKDDRGEKERRGGEKERREDGRLTVPELIYFFFLPFFLGFRTCFTTQDYRLQVSHILSHKPQNKEQTIITIQIEKNKQLLLTNEIYLYMLRAHLVNIKLVFSSGHFSVAGGKLPDEVVTADRQAELAS